MALPLTRSLSHPTKAIVSPIPTIARQARELYEKAQRGECTARDLALCVELNQKYVDYLDTIETHCSSAVTIQIEGEKVRFENADQLADFLAGVMNHG